MIGDGVRNFGGRRTADYRSLLRTTWALLPCGGSATWVSDEAFPSDCNASFDEGMHQASLKTIDMFFGRVMTTKELLDEMRNELGRNDRVAAE